MHAPAEKLQPHEPQYHGLRMTADEFFGLENDGFRYELVNGVVCMSPSPTPRHQEIAALITTLIGSYLLKNRVGRLFHETDLDVGTAPQGGDLVYRPDIVFVRSDKKTPRPTRLVRADLVVEVFSPSSRQFDSVTKLEDYARAGILEYWLIDPEREELTFYRLKNNRYIEIKPEGDRFLSEAIPGFSLELVPIREMLNE